MTSVDLTDSRARWRGFRDAAHYLDLAGNLLAKEGRLPGWVYREYRAIYRGEMWLPRSEGAVTEERVL